MFGSFEESLSSGLFLVVFFVVVLVTVVIGYWVGQRTSPAKEGTGDAALNTALAAILGVVALVLSFSFSFSLSRYDARRLLVVQESNDIGTLYLRTSVLDKPAADSLRAIIRDYTARRITYYLDGNDPAAQARDQVASDGLQNQMWTIVSDAVRANPRSQGPSLLMQVTNDVIDTSAEQAAELHYRLRGPGLFLIFLVAIVGAFVIGLGFGSARTPNWIVSLIFVMLMAVLVNTIIDLDSPQGGRIHVNLTPLYDLQHSMGRP